MTAMKTMLMSVVDVGFTMNAGISGTHNDNNNNNNNNNIDTSQKYYHDKKNNDRNLHNKIGIATRFISNFIIQRMISTKTSEFGVVTYGSDMTGNYLNSTQGGYENVTETLPIRRPDMETIRTINNITPSRSQVGDMIDGIVVGQDILIRVNQKLKFNRILLLVTDGETKVEGIEDLETIATQMINETKIELYVAMIGKVVDDSSIIKKNNAKLLYSLAQSVKGRFIMIDNYLEGIHLFASAPGLCTKPQLPQIMFQLSPTVKIPCIYFSKNMKSKLPSLKKQVANNNSSTSDLIGGGYSIGAVKAENDDLYSSSSSNALKRDTVYRNPDDPDLELDADERVKGYRYGSQYIPLTAEDEEMFKIPGNSGITVIGAIPLSDIVRHHFLEGPIIIKGQQEYDCTQQAIASISYALKSTSKALLVRFVKRDKADPVLSAVLASDHPNQCDCLIMHRLPFVDDIRDFLFRSIDVPNDANLSHKKSIVSSYVDAMTIRNVPSNILTPSNPILQNAFNVINDKICNCHPISSSSSSSSEGLLPLLTRDCLIDSMVCPVHLISGTSSNRIAAIVQSISSTYQLQRQDVSKSRKKRKKKYWSTLKAEAVVTTTIPTTDSSIGAAAHDAAADGAAVVGPDRVGLVEEPSRVHDGEVGEEDEEELLPEFHVGSMNPIEDFELLVMEAAKLDDAEDQEIVLLDAMTTMSTIIETCITIGACPFQYTRAIEFLASFRSVSIKYHQVDFFNSFLQVTLKPFQRSNSRHQLFWKLLSESNTTLISSAEEHSSIVSPIEAKEFLK